MLRYFQEEYDTWDPNLRDPNIQLVSMRPGLVLLTVSAEATPACTFRRCPLAWSAGNFILASIGPLHLVRFELMETKAELLPSRTCQEYLFV